MPKLARNPSAVLDRKKPTRKLAIHAFCYECEGGDADEGVNWRIGNCPVLTCQLWDYRPYQERYKTKPPKVLEDSYSG